MKVVSVTAPAFNEAENLEDLTTAVAAVFDDLPDLEYEIVISENGSTDNSLEVLERLNASNGRIKYVSLSRNFGHQGGILAGLAHCSGDAIVSMDADLQHPPEEIKKMVQAWADGAQVVEMQRKEKSTSHLRRMINSAFYLFTNAISGLALEQGDFRLLDRKVLDHLLALPEKEKYLRGLVPWFGFRKVCLPYNVGQRTRGRSKFSLKQLVNLAFNGITSFSVLPLRTVMNLGFFLLIPSIALLVYFLILGINFYFFGSKNLLPPGWATQTVVITFFGSIQLLSIGILGEYIGRIFIETKGRPAFVVAKSNLGNSK